jgi:DNA-binding winged helix-turn-helix (wHTH) protein
VNIWYELGPFRLDARAGVLTLNGMPVALGARGASVLAMLVEHATRYVSKASLLEHAWPGLVVEEGNLAVQISAIRRALGAAPGGERWIETLARRGYRFVGPVIAVPERDFRVADAEDRRRCNLPEPLTSFIGRERELVDLKHLLPKVRLVTLTGIGGIGKTRLALQLSAQVVDAYRDGVWWVELAPLSDPTLVPSAVAQVLQVRESSGKAVEQAMCAYLKRRQLMLVLDNCEHLRQACAELALALLRAGPETTILATSREPLHASGEQIYPLASLSLPPADASLESMATSEAVQLFLARARGQQPHFEVTEKSAPALAGLCIHLDGIPLALELAAVRVPSLSLEQIGTRLHDRFRLLTGGAANATAAADAAQHARLELHAARGRTARPLAAAGGFSGRLRT